MNSANNTSAERGFGLLQELVATPSFSGSERPAVNLLVNWMNRAGYTAHCDAAGNAVGVLEGGPGPGGEPPCEILLLGHIDTVRGFPKVQLRDGRLYGRGAVDAKGPLAAFATAASAIGRRPGFRLVVAGAVEEESATSRGARHLAARRRPEMVVIGEPTGWERVAVGYKGRLVVHASFQRRMSHSAGPAASAPDLAFAFWQRVLAAADARNAGQAKVWDHLQAHLAGFESSCDGVLEQAELRCAFRLPASLDPSELEGLLAGLAGEAALRFSGEERAFRAEKNTPLVRAFVGSVREQQGCPGFLLKTGTSDMNVVGPVWSCPILAYGPGDSALDHTPEEHVEVEEWRRGVDVLVSALDRLTCV